MHKIHNADKSEQTEYLFLKNDIDSLPEPLRRLFIRLENINHDLRLRVKELEEKQYELEQKINNHNCKYFDR